MKNDEVLRGTPLFFGLSDPELSALLLCQNPQEEAYPRDAFILRAGAATKRAGLLLAGAVHILEEDFWGNRSILTELGPGELFAETYAVSALPLRVSVLSAEPCRVLWLDLARLLHPCGRCAGHEAVLRNLMRELARKNLLLTQKLEYLSRRSTKEKLLSYLSDQAARQHSSVFTVPFNRQQLADYLSVDRSAMSSALAKLQREGVLRFSRSRFELLTPSARPASGCTPPGR